MQSVAASFIATIIVLWAALNTLGAVPLSDQRMYQLDMATQNLWQPCDVPDTCFRFNRATSHTSQGPWPWNCESPNESVQRSSQTHLQNHVVWWWTLNCSVRSYVTKPSTKCYSMKLCSRMHGDVTPLSSWTPCARQVCYPYIICHRQY